VLVKNHNWTYRVLQEFYQGVCTDYCDNGKFVEEGHQISMEQGLSVGIGYFEGEDGDKTYFSVFPLGKYISCACRCISDSTWRNFGVARSR
jgi:hypothetical protein